MSLTELKISARSSQLAKIQAVMVGDHLMAKNPGLKIRYEFRESLGDKNLHDPLWKMPQKGVFTEDFYLDLVEGRTDMVVHSWKDLPVENKPDTHIAATLPRADQRDILILKKDRAGKKKIRVFTSSPRREYNLRPFFLKALPAGTDEIEFVNIRGNVPTRLRKFLAEDTVDGLVLAKAAVDRFVTSEWSEVFDVQKEIKSIFQAHLWMVLPLSVNPNAAAQGALAVEIINSRTDLKSILTSIHCEKTFKSAQTERITLKSYGGGCHQKIGVTHLMRDYGELFYLQGKTDQGVILNEKKMTPTVAYPEFKNKWSSSVLNQFIEKKDLDFKIPASVNGLFVSKISAWKQPFSGYVWASGLETWFSLAKQGVWVNGSSEGLGEFEDKRVQHLTDQIEWAKLTHADASEKGQHKSIATYKMMFNFDSKQQSDINLAAAINSADILFWTSAAHYDFVANLNPEMASLLKQKKHACGLGNTAKILSEKLGHSPYLYLSEYDFLKN